MIKIELFYFLILNLKWIDGVLGFWGFGGGAHGRWVAQAVNNRKASSSVAQ